MPLHGIADAMEYASFRSTYCGYTGNRGTLTQDLLLLPAVGRIPSNENHRVRTTVGIVVRQRRFGVGNPLAIDGEQILVCAGGQFYLQCPDTACMAHHWIGIWRPVVELACQAHLLGL